MMLLRTLILLPLLFAGANVFHKENPITCFTIADSIPVEVDAYYDSLGLLTHYGARIYTPVCEEKKCYAIEIVFYWDALGRFIQYDTIPGKGLTKLDHIPFTDNDYVRLGEILSNENSLLALYPQEELVKDTRSSKIDGFTGATIQEIKESVIGGAVYSCYTLWHIAHGPVKDSLQTATRKQFSRKLVQQLVSQEDQAVNYFLINSFAASEFELYLLEILQAIESGKGYFAKNAIEKMPVDLINEAQTQRFFAGKFKQFDYFTQVALLEKLNSQSLSEEMKSLLEQELEERNSYKASLINTLLSHELPEVK